MFGCFECLSPSLKDTFMWCLALNITANLTDWECVNALTTNTSGLSFSSCVTSAAECENSCWFGYLYYSSWPCENIPLFSLTLTVSLLLVAFFVYVASFSLSSPLKIWKNIVSCSIHDVVGDSEMQFCASCGFFWKNSSLLNVSSPQSDFDNESVTSSVLKLVHNSSEVGESESEPIGSQLNFSFCPFHFHQSVFAFLSVVGLFSSLNSLMLFDSFFFLLLSYVISLICIGFTLFILIKCWNISYFKTDVSENSVAMNNNTPSFQSKANALANLSIAKNNHKVA